MPNFDSGTTTALEKEITLLLGGVGTAFYVSIYGIFLSLWWTFFEKIGMTRFEHDAIIIKENTKSFFWTKIDIESIHIKSSLENFSKMTQIFEQITSKDLLDNISNSLENRLNVLESVIEKETLLSNSISENINNNKELFDMVKVLTLNVSTTIQKFDDEKLDYAKSSLILSENIEKLNEALSHVNSNNIESLYTNIIKSVTTMKNEMDRIGWRFNQELDDYDTKFNENLKNSLEAIDDQTVKIIEDLQEFKELSK